MIFANFVLSFLRVSVDVHHSIVLNIICSCCSHSTKCLSCQYSNNKLIMFIATHLINIRSCFHLEIFSLCYFPFYQVLLQIAATFCKQGFLYFLFFFSCLCTAVAQGRTDLWLGSKSLPCYKQRQCMES